MRILVARCTITYEGRLVTTLGSGDRVIMFKADGAVVVHSGAAGAKPVNYMPGPTSVSEEGRVISVYRPASDERLEIEVEDVHADSRHELADEEKLRKHGDEKQLQERLFANVEAIEEGMVALKRELFTDVGPVDLFCRDAQGRTCVIEVKRIKATAAAVEQLTRYHEQVARNEGLGELRPILIAPELAPQARVLLESRGYEWMPLGEILERCGDEVPDLALF